MQTTRNMIITCVYRSPGTDLKSFGDSLETIIGDTKSKKAMFICSDLNIDILKHDSNKGCRGYKQTVLARVSNLLQPYIGVSLANLYTD